MPRLPTQDDYGLRTPAAARRLVDAPAIRQTPDLLTGRAMQDIGAMMQAEAEKMDETVAQDALNKLQEKQLELTYGESGFTKLQGKAVIDGKITDAYPLQLKQEAERLRGTINGARAQARFDASSAGVLQGFKRGTYMHAAKETETYYTATEDDTVTTQAQAANMAAQSGNVEGVALAVGVGRKAVEAAVLRRGLEGPQADAYRQRALGTIHSDVINGLLDSNQPALASAWLKSSRKEMTVAQADKFDARVKSDMSWAAGDTFVREMLAQGKTPSEAEAALAAEAIAKGDKDMRASGMQTLSDLNTLRTQTYAQNADKAQDEINRGSPWRKVRAKYLDTMDPSVVAAFDARATALAKEGAVKTDFAAYYDLSIMPPEQFAKVDLRTYVGKISDTNLRTLSDRQGKIINKDEKEIKDTVTLQQQLSIAHAELGFGTGAGSREKKGMFNDYIVSEVRAQEKVKGKSLTDDERDGIIKRAMITRNNSWNQFRTKLYYEVAGTSDAKDFVPEIPQRHREAILASFVREGKQPTEADIVARYKKKNRIP